ncbi:TrmB family transcriptional regulator [Haloparvum sp. PAK95]|uniref:TrmB family transcriptional regulator n=1 Tax=Haloparvum sp. PAK95 TaxID=3418962 RepID=UPI003D2ED37D
MTPDPIDSPSSTAIEQLQAFGLSTYASRMYVALLRNGVSTARGVSEVADVPRTRVYDAAEELLENDLIDVEEHSPKHFDPVPARDAIRKLRQEYRYREATLTAVLSMLEGENDDESDVRTVTGRAEVVDCLVDVVRAATEEIILVTDGTPLSEDLLNTLSEAAEDGIQVRIVGDGGGNGDGHDDAIATHIPDVETVTRIPETTDIPDGKRLLVDGTQAVVTVSVGRDRSIDPTLAVWGTGERNLLVEMLKDALTEWFDDETVSASRSE